MTSEHFFWTLLLWTHYWQKIFFKSKGGFNELSVCSCVWIRLCTMFWTSFIGAVRIDLEESFVRVKHPSQKPTNLHKSESGMRCWWGIIAFCWWRFQLFESTMETRFVQSYGFHRGVSWVCFKKAHLCNTVRVSEREKREKCLPCGTSRPS